MIYSLLGRTLDARFRHTRQLGARQALITMTCINILSFADRYIPASVKPLYQADLKLNDFESSLPATGMVVVYLIFSVFFGTMADKQIMDRRVLLFIGVTFWSVATALAGLSQNLIQLIALRSLVGVGEAVLGPIGPPLLADFFPSHERSVMFGLYYLAMPIGGALGYAIGAVIGGAVGWRYSFVACGLPGVVAAFALLRLNNPARGVNDPLDPQELGESQVQQHRYRQQQQQQRRQETAYVTTVDEDESSSSLTSSNMNVRTFPSTDRITGVATSSQSIFADIAHLLADIWELLTNGEYMFATLGLTAGCFAVGAVSDWYDTFLVRYCHATLSSAGLILGAATVLGGIGGAIGGSKLSDFFVTRVRSAYFFVPACGMYLSALFLFLGINITSSLALNSFFVIMAEVCMFVYLAPISTVSINAVPPRLRARSAGLQILFMHVLGDVISPPIVGFLSDQADSLQVALQISWIALLLAGSIWMAACFLLKPLKDSRLRHNNNNNHNNNITRSRSNKMGRVKTKSLEENEWQEQPLTQHDMLVDADAVNYNDPELVADGIVVVDNDDDVDDADVAGRRTNGSNSNSSSSVHHVSFTSILCGEEPLVVDKQGFVTLR